MTDLELKSSTSNDIDLMKPRYLERDIFEK